ncbi:MAG TPA: DUF4249 domain-containing protein [Ohtaekwangia sp.]|uniref:DUF4249 domain-containing protein n=1 Tax=Ohtaekwangia sp. TaxID=2066019 RepID=UPI002F95CD47
MKQLILIIITGICIASACTPESDLDAIAYTPKLVIDGSIEDNGFARVVLSYSSSYFENIDSASIRKLLVTTAKVVVSDGEQEEILTLKRDETAFPPYVYQSTSLKGKAGKTYKLTITLKGETYTATTSIPPPAALDRVWFELAPGKDSVGYVYGTLTDDPAVDNYYRVFTLRKNIDDRFIPVYLSAIGDQYFNGKKFTFTILRGPENFTNITDDLYFTLGDTIRVKLCTMDKAHFDFWRTVERELYVVGNPFASSGNEIISNIDNKKALGVWGGYGVSYYQLVAKE